MQKKPLSIISQDHVDWSVELMQSSRLGISLQLTLDGMIRLVVGSSDICLWNQIG